MTLASLTDAALDPTTIAAFLGGLVGAQLHAVRLVRAAVAPIVARLTRIEGTCKARHADAPTVEVLR